MNEHLKQMVDDLFVSVKGFVLKHLGPLDVRVKALEARQPEKGEKGADGLDGMSVSLDDLQGFIKGAVEANVALIPKPKDGVSIKGDRGEDGKSIDPAEFFAKVNEAAERAVEKLPKPKDGTDGLKGKDADEKTIADSVLGKVLDVLDKIEPPKDGKDGTNGTNGKDADPETVKALISSLLPGMVEKAAVMLAERIDADIKEARIELGERIIEQIKAIPPAPAGKDADPEVVLRMVKDAFALVPIPKDGTNGKDAISPSIEDFRPMLEGEVAKAVALLPPPRDGRDATGKKGEDGINGRDGLSFKDLKFEMVGDRTLRMWAKQSDGEIVSQEFELTGLPVYQGVYRVGEYEKGDAITYGGTIWIAKRDTDKAPGGNDDWQMAVKGTR